MFGGGFFFFDVFVDEARNPAAAKAARRFVLGFSFGVAHETFVKGLLCADKIVVIKSYFAALAAL
jgi:hypothetical protein